MEQLRRRSGFFSRLTMLGGILTTVLSLLTGRAGAHEAYDTEMVRLIHEIHEYAKARQPSFGLLANGGAALFLPYDGNTPENVKKQLSNLDGQLVESVFFGYDMKDGAAAPDDASAYFKKALAVPQRTGMPVFNLDYVHTARQAEDSYEKNRRQGYVSWASFHRLLDTMPEEPPRHVNADDCTSLRDVRNFMVLLNPGHFSSREAYLDALRQSGYDLLILDLFYGDRALTAHEVRTLQQKPQGGRRLVYAYMSVGEAENYRSYWRPEWDRKKPSWLAERNEAWGSFHVKYWRREWKNILYGTPDAYLDTILAAGFDGAFLDVVDGYQYFQQREGTES